MAGIRAPRHVRIFLASPGDVRDERQAVRALVQQMERTPLIRRDFTLEVVSWDDPGGPVPMLAMLTPQQAIARALPKPSECDVTVVILWGRMGTPLDELRPDGRPYVSGTEWEFEDAKRARKPILVYRRTSGLEGPTDEEDDRQRRSLAEFFAQFTGPGGTLKGGVTIYETVDQLIARLRTDIEYLLVPLRLSDDPQRADRGWLGRQQAYVRQWTRGRLALVLASGTFASLVAGTAFISFTSALERYDAPTPAYAMRYAFLIVAALVPLTLLLLLWWWLGRERSAQTNASGSGGS
jgi:hypothetical protein